MKSLAFTIAGQNITAPGGVPTGGFDTSTGNNILGWGLNLLFVLGTVLVILYMLWGGVQWITSGGDKQKLANARNRLVYSIIGLLVIAFAMFIVNFVLFFLGGKLFST